MSYITRNAMIAATAWCMAADKGGNGGTVKNVYQPDPDQTPVTKKSEAILAYTALLEEMDHVGDDGDTVIDAEQIWAIVRAVHGQGEDVEAQRANALDAACKLATGSDGDTPHDDLSSKSDDKERAILNDMGPSEFGKTFPPSLLEDVRLGVKGREDQRRAPLRFRRDFLKEYGAERMRSMPRPGTPNKASGDTGGNNPDKIDEYYVKDGERKSRKVSSYDKIWAATTDGLYQLAERDAYAAALKDKPEGKYANTRRDDLILNKDTWAKRFTASTKVMKDAFKIEQQIAAIQQYTPNVLVEVKMKRDKEGRITDEPSTSSRPIVCANKDDMGSAEYFSVGSFLLLKPRKAGDKAVGGTVSALKATAARGTKSGAPTAANIPDLKTAEDWAKLLGHAFAADTFNSLFRKRMHTEGEDADMMLKTWGDMYTELAVYYAPQLNDGTKVIQPRGEVRLRYEQVSERINKAEQKEREIKAKLLADAHNADVKAGKAAA